MKLILNLIMRLYAECFGEPDFSWALFSSDPKTRGKTADGLVVHGPAEIPALRPDLILIDTYRFDEEIKRSLAQYEELGFRVEKLHRETEAPLVL